jgi:hypothetical protein
MAILSFIIGLLLILILLWETFETIVLPRTVVRHLRLARLYYYYAWKLYSKGVPGMGSGNRREGYLSTFGPLSLLLLLFLWALGLIFGFALIQWGLGSQVLPGHVRPGFGTDLYLSGTTFITLGLGDVLPGTPIARFVTVMEAGVGFGFLAIVIGYLPVIYQAFSRREVGISLLDARAGSPPCAGEMLRRHGQAQSMESLVALLYQFEQWASDLMESHLSYPVLAYYRSQHDRESWLFALTAIMDTCALIGARLESAAKDAPEWERALVWQAHLTFAMARHAIVDLALVFNAPPMPPAVDRLPPEDLVPLRDLLASGGITLKDDPATLARLTTLREQYEPFVNAMAKRMLLSLPPWLPDADSNDNWQTSAWSHGAHF